MPASSSRPLSRRAQIEARIQATRPQKSGGSPARLLLVGAVLLVGQIGLATRLYRLQVREAPGLQAKARQQQRDTLSPRLRRYPITDRKGSILAQDQPGFRLYVHPAVFGKAQSSAEVAAKLAPILQDQSAAELQALFKTQKTGISVEQYLSEDQADRIRKLYLNGLELEPQWQRTYPHRELTAGVIGFVNVDHQGLAGIEYSHPQLLSAQQQPWPITWDPQTDRSQPVSWDGRGGLLPDLFAPKQSTAADLTLRVTLDTRLQRSARSALRQQMQKFQAARGTVMVMDVNDGSLVALASEPSFDPKYYYKTKPSLFKNWAVSDLYEPGSTFKPINVAIALELGAVQAHSQFYDEGRISVGGWPINNNDGKGRGSLSVTQILEYSSNVGMVHIVEQMQRSDYYDFLKKIGIGSMTGTDLPFETPGQFKDKQQFVDYPIEPATTAFGQGFSLTPLQLAQLHGAIANGGKLVTPHVIDGLYNQAGEKVQGLDQTQPRQVFSAATAAHVQTMMGSVVANGTGQPAQIPGYRLGGKTGTAQKARGGVYVNARITSFASFFPLKSPKYIVLAVVDEPQGGNAYGSTVAAPIVKSVIETIISVEGIPPSHPAELKKGVSQ